MGFLKHLILKVQSMIELKFLLHDLILETYSHPQLNGITNVLFKVIKMVILRHILFYCLYVFITK